MKTYTYLLNVVVIVAIALTGCTQRQTISDLQEEINLLKAELQRVNDEKALTDKRLAEFDKLDFDYYSGQLWDKFNESHSDNIKVFYPDGTTTEGIYPQHIDMLKPMFVFAPDTKIKTHPVRFGSGEWTAVIGVMEGTFSKPMPIGGGKSIPPTGKKFKLSMATIGHWKGDKMIEEYLFWDNQAFMTQISTATP